MPLLELTRACLNYASPFRKTTVKRDRKPILDSFDLVGMVLWFVKGKDYNYRVCRIFCVVQSILSVWFNYSLKFFYDLVRNTSNPYFYIKGPSIQEIQSSTNLLGNNRQNRALLQGVFEVIDSGRKKYASYSDPNLQKAYW